MNFANNYPWYNEVSNVADLEQGDLIFNCQIIRPTSSKCKEGQKIEAKICEYNVIIISQSCDLLSKKIELASVCPFYTLKKLENIHKDYQSKAMKEKLRRGHVVGFHLLNKLDMVGIHDCLVVDFKQVYSIPLNLLENMAKSCRKRKRLLPPYREHLSQAFARFYMRVGLPADIPKFD